VGAAAQCDKLAIVELWTPLATVDKKSAKFMVWNKVPEGTAFILGDTRIPYNIV